MRIAFLLALALVGCAPDRSRTSEVDGRVEADANIPTEASVSDDGGPDGFLPMPDGRVSDGSVEPDGGPDVCAPISGVSYATSPTVGDVTDRPAAQHADINLKLRGWELTAGTLGLVQISGPTDTGAPKLNTMFADHRVPTFVQNYQVYQWDWGSNSRGGLVTDPEVTLTGMEVAPAEVLHLPRSGYEIAPGLQARVLFVDDDSITLKYTGEDNVVWGYTVHIVGICVEPSLRALYESSNTAGRTVLPALAAEQPFARARTTEILVSIRDTGTFMDPRSEKDWW